MIDHYGEPRPRLSFHRNAPADLVSVERMIDHYGEPHSRLSFHRNAPADLVSVERMIDHYGEPRPRLPPPQREPVWPAADPQGSQLVANRFVHRHGAGGAMWIGAGAAGSGQSSVHWHRASGAVRPAVARNKTAIKTASPFRGKLIEFCAAHTACAAVLDHVIVACTGDATAQDAKWKKTVAQWNAWLRATTLRCWLRHPHTACAVYMGEAASKCHGGQKRGAG